MPYTTSTTAGESSFISRRNTPHTIQNCSLYVGRPLSREEAVAKMERSPQFLEAAHDFGPQQDIVQNAVQLDYGIRLRNCLAAAGMGQWTYTHTHTQLPSVLSVDSLSHLANPWIFLHELYIKRMEPRLYQVLHFVTIEVVSFTSLTKLYLWRSNTLYKWDNKNRTTLRSSLSAVDAVSFTCLEKPICLWKAPTPGDRRVNHSPESLFPLYLYNNDYTISLHKERESEYYVETMFGIREDNAG
jgi:hypothetical protein